MSQVLDPLRFPLYGSRLIEASAGTGKTFTLALLYTRLVLGHGPEGTAFARPLLPSEILVVTFTDAATKELRDRIRARLVAAADVFGADPGRSIAGDPDPLIALRADYSPAQWPACARRLRLAAECMDEAIIATIHAWCYRMLEQHAFATRGLFQRELVTDQADLVAEIVRDYWRVHFYPLPPEQARCVQGVVPSPEALQGKLQAWLIRSDARPAYRGEPLSSDRLDQALKAQCRWQARKAEVEAEQLRLDERLRALEDRARAQWQAHRVQVEQHLRELRPYLSGTRHDSAGADKFDALLARFAAWARGAPAPNKLQNFAQGAFSFNKNAKVRTEIAHPAFQAIADWQRAGGGRPALPEPPEPPLAACLLAHAAAWVKDELQRRLLARAEMGFDDLLGQLDAALMPGAVRSRNPGPRSDDGPNPDQGPGAHLAETIRRQFPVALIDEFQDTDPVQYRIFERIFEPLCAGPDVPADRALVMIGDPKQSIYGFRGADIHTYLDARRATAGRHYTLGTNYRATEAAVAACNRLFLYAEEQSRGAFRFKTPDHHPIPFVEVTAKGRPEQLILAGAEAPAMTFWTLEQGSEAVGQVDYRRWMAAAAAAAIAGWLRQADAGKAGFRAAGRLRPLRSRDIAILVRTGTEAKAIREALARHRIASVYLSDRDSVMDTQEANDLLHWLRACAAPTDEALVRAALGTTTMARPLAQLARLQRDELAWEAELERFRGYAAIWRQQGVLAMLRRLLQDADLPARLIADPNGERILTNLLHLAEWLQQSATAIDGEQALMRHLSEHLQGTPQRGRLGIGGTSGDELIVRLESDAELVQVISIHKSKGLEYPLVLLPFICSWREVDGKTKQLLCRHRGQRLIELASKDRFKQAWTAADDERLSEDMRLLYVAVTRAMHAVWLGIAPLKSGNAKTPQLEKSAIGHVLNGGAKFGGPVQIWEALARLRGDSPRMHRQMRIEPAPNLGPCPAQRRPAGDGGKALDDARTAPMTRPPPWWIASYSALRRPVADAEQGASVPLAAADPARTASPSADTARQETALEENLLDTSRQGALDDDGVASRLGPRAKKDKHLHAFPRGSGPGTFLHGILEWAAVQCVSGRNEIQLRGFAAAAASPALRREMLARRCNLRGLRDWIEPLNEWLEDFLARDWSLQGLVDARSPAPRLALRDLSPAQMQVEMEFWLESHRVETAVIDQWMQRHVLAGRQRPGLDNTLLNGVLKGFIDLVLEYGGRYYVLDWKSNWLGVDDSAYTAEAMRDAILHARYDLQYVLYLLALHRQLRARLPGYDYDQHVGGAIYAFLRGAYSDTQGLYMDRPPRILIEALDDLFAGETERPTEPTG